MERYIDRLDVKSSTRTTTKEDEALKEFAKDKKKLKSAAIRRLIREGLKSYGYLAD